MTTTPLPATINGSTVNLDVDPATPLADVLRDQCGLTATHIGCRNGDCVDERIGVRGRHCRRQP